MMKVYISQPYVYKADDEIKRVRNYIIDGLHSYLKEVEILDSMILKDQTFGLKQLSQCIMILSGADAIVFAPNWRESKGCRIEYQIAKEFHVPIIDLKEVN